MRIAARTTTTGAIKRGGPPRSRSHGSAQRHTAPALLQASPVSPYHTDPTYDPAAARSLEQTTTKPPPSQRGTDAT